MFHTIIRSEWIKACLFVCFNCHIYYIISVDLVALYLFWACNVFCCICVTVIQFSTKSFAVQEKQKYKMKRLTSIDHGAKLNDFDIIYLLFLIRLFLMSSWKKIIFLEKLSWRYCPWPFWRIFAPSCFCIEFIPDSVVYYFVAFYRFS